MNTRLSAALVTVALAASAATAQSPLGTAFTYQGQLKNGGGPAGGSFNMVFKLFDAVTVGNQIGPTLTFDGVGGNPPPVVVAAGLFTVQLDFGGIAYNGDKRWLEITVSGTLLTPRQELTAAPYARFSAAPWATSGANISNTNTGFVGIGTASPTNLLHLVDPSVAQLKVERTAGSQFLVQATGTFTRIGTTSSATPLRFLIGGNDQMTLDASGRLGIGTTVPEGDLHVFRASAGTITANANAPLVVENNTSNYLNILAPDANESGVLFGRPGSSATSAAGGIVFNNSANTDGLQFRTGGNATRMTIDSAGDVGIGTTTPTGKLHVVAASGDASVVLPTGSISAEEIGDEVGIAADIGSSSVSLTQGVLRTLATRTISVPRNGYVLAIATFDVYRSIQTGNDAIDAAVGPNNTDVLASENNRTLITFDTTIASSTGFPCTFQGIFSVNAGSNTFYVIAQGNASPATLAIRPHLSLIFIPTSYGTVDVENP